MTIEEQGVDNALAPKIDLIVMGPRIAVGMGSHQGAIQGFPIIIPVVVNPIG